MSVRVCIKQLYTIEENINRSVFSCLRGHAIHFVLYLTYLFIVTDGVDYTGVASSLTFLAGDGHLTTIPFSFPIRDDSIVESIETISLEASAGFPAQFSRDTTIVTITDNDGESLIPDSCIHY